MSSSSYILDINLTEDKILLPDDKTITFSISRSYKDRIIELDDIELTLRNKDQIKNYENQMKLSSHGCLIMVKNIFFSWGWNRSWDYNWAIKIIDFLNESKMTDIHYEFGDIGSASLDKYNKPITDETLEKARKSDAVLLASVGTPKYDNNMRA